MTCASVFGQDSVLIELLVYAINGLDILAGDIQNDYLNYTAKNNLFFYSGEEWKSDCGRVILIVPDIYGLKYSALIWRNNIADIIDKNLD